MFKDIFNIQVSLIYNSIKGQNMTKYKTNSFKLHLCLTAWDELRGDELEDDRLPQLLKTTTNVWQLLQHKHFV